MFLYLSKIIPTILMPFSLSLLLVLTAMFIRKWRTLLLVLAILVILTPATPLVSDFLTGSLERQFPDRGLEYLPPAQAIVVLGGTIETPGGTHHESHLVSSSDRLLVALRLYHEKKAPLILCTGGNLPILGTPTEVPEAETMRSMLEEWDVPADAILVEEHSVNTHQNAINSYGLLNSRGITKILLVTSALHMPRAVATFSKAGFDVTPAPADFITGWEGDSLSWIPNSGSLSDAQRAAREWLGLWTYRMRGWAL